MNWLETLDNEIAGWEAIEGRKPKEIQISSDDWMEFKTQVSEFTGQEIWLEMEDFLTYKNVDIIPNDLLGSENFIIIK